MQSVVLLQSTAWSATIGLSYMDQSHDIPGGAAHSFDIKGYHFDSVPNVVIFRALVSRCAGQPLSPACRIYSKSLNQMQGRMAQAPGRNNTFLNFRPVTCFDIWFFCFKNFHFQYILVSCSWPCTVLYMSCLSEKQFFRDRQQPSCRDMYRMPEAPGTSLEPRGQSLLQDFLKFGPQGFIRAGNLPGILWSWWTRSRFAMLSRNCCSSSSPV
ncbi:hypothetical protein KC19_6G047100 [Ceratodon purpureus]|uniref:Uncharacterized protein n=1 Tax=Ceratodon purpureus TaxID=3225 RepID=A0A8T0HD31_CERPU|nr:hypothetical protein KC19_6G047100 [Ceratodon purpureus]